MLGKIQYANEMRVSGDVKVGPHLIGFSLERFELYNEVYKGKRIFD